MEGSLFWYSAILILYAVSVFKQDGIDGDKHLAAILAAILRILGGVFVNPQS